MLTWLSQGWLHMIGESKQLDSVSNQLKTFPRYQFISNILKRYLKQTVETVMFYEKWKGHTFLKQTHFKMQHAPRLRFVLISTVPFFSPGMKAKTRV